MSKAVKIVVVAVVSIAALGFGGSWVYINLIKQDAPDRLGFDDATSRTTTTSMATPTSGPTSARDDEVDGTWRVGDGTQVGYRVKEILFGQRTEAVGRTTNVTGSLTIAGATVTASRFDVDMASIESDESRRDRAFRGDVMDVARFPTASFELDEPIELRAIPTDGIEIPVTARGTLTLRGTSNAVGLSLTAKRSGPTIQVLGSFEVVFEDWGIPNPSRGPVATEDRGKLELLLVFTRS